MESRGEGKQFFFFFYFIKKNWIFDFFFNFKIFVKSDKRGWGYAHIRFPPTLLEFVLIIIPHTILLISFDDWYRPISLLADIIHRKLDL